MSHIRNPYERSRAEKRESRRLERQIRRDLVKGDGESRPEWCWSALQRLRREHNPETVEQEEKAKGRAQATVERLLATLAWGAWIAVVLATLVDAIFAHGDSKSVVYGCTTAGIGVAALAAFLLVAILFDVATYRPRVFAECLGPPSDFFQSLAELSPELESQVDKIAHERPDSWKRVKHLEQGLLAESIDFITPDGIRTKVNLRVFHRLGALLASLALLGYGLSAATGGDLLRSCSSLSQCGAHHSAVTLPEHIYFSLIAFFNGFSDLQLVHGVVGYAYLLTVVVSFVAVVYFFLTDAIASQSEFRANMRAAAESFVLQQSSL
jgi:hypothetical protein